MTRGRSILVAAGLLLLASASLAQEGRRFDGLNLSNDEPIQIESDRFEVDENQHLATFSGNVSVIQGPTIFKASRMKVFYRSNGGSATTGSADIERLEADGGVYVKSENQVATGDHGTFDMATEVLVLSGKEVVLSEGENVIVGCKLTVQIKSGQATLESCEEAGSTGRVRMLLSPGSQSR
ncbi:LptA/OstA family protein [Chelativorans sp. Marseille-P2723]|uniref:LptA/OstA family protein n=1 Tax=Chelativorans sp. Marseille-P2723 TaxID=2709133 RepID=UPI00156E0668|nr:LptA/OstA family protein [Chelativorans sp. Marseille-P2723]